MPRHKNDGRWAKTNRATKEKTQRDKEMIDWRGTISKYREGGKRGRYVGAEEIRAKMDAQVQAEMVKFRRSILLEIND
jgi:hypothetical protein